MSEERPLYVRLPAEEAEKLDRAAHNLRLAKKDLVTALIQRHLDPPAEGPPPAMRGVEPPADGPRRVVVELGSDQLTVGHAAVRPAEPPEVLTLAQLADLVQVHTEELATMAESGE